MRVTYFISMTVYMKYVIRPHKRSGTHGFGSELGPSGVMALAGAS